LEGFSAAVAGDVSDRAFSSDIRIRKDQFQSDQQQDRHRIRYQKVDAESGEEVPSEDIIKGYKVDTDRYLEVTKDEIENIALESTRTIEIDELSRAVKSTTFTWFDLLLGA
jgi:non-homologous end joining protein Ku